MSELPSDPEVPSIASEEARRLLTRCTDRLEAGSDVAVGIDLVSIERVRRILERHGDRFRESSFTARERRYCEARADPAQHYAARWAVKESFVKALSERGHTGRPAFTSIEVRHTPEPRLSLSGVAQAALRDAAGSEGTTTEVSVSLAHDLAADTAGGAVVILAR